jgi:molecular chaperone GrpE
MDDNTTDFSIPTEPLTHESEVAMGDSVDLEAEVTALKAQLQEESANRLRAYADLENFRKRKDQELANFKKYAQEKFVLELMPVLDSFALALQHNADGSSENTQKVLEGVTLIQKQLTGVFDKMGIRRIEALGQKFDPNFHQAIGQEDSDQGADLVIKEMQAGYLLHDRVIRPSMVIVSK